MKINREETLRRMEVAAPSDEELANAEAVLPSELDDHDLIMCYGSLLELACRKNEEINLDEWLDEIRSRAARYVREMLFQENLLVMEDE